MDKSPTEITSVGLFIDQKRTNYRNTRSAGGQGGSRRSGTGFR